MKNIFLGLCFYFVTLCIGYGQDISVVNRGIQDFASDMRFKGSVSGTNAIYEGSAYLEKEFVNGDIYTSSADKFSEIPMRYNALEDEIEVAMPDGKFYYLSGKAEIISVRMGNREMVYTSFANSTGLMNGFLTVLYRGNTILYKKNTKIYREGTASNGIIPASPPAIVDINPVYLLAIKAINPTKISGKKDLLTLMADHEKEMEAFLKKEKVTLKNEAGLISAISYYDSLK